VAEHIQALEVACTLGQVAAPTRGREEVCTQAQGAALTLVQVEGSTLGQVAAPTPDLAVVCILVLVVDCILVRAVVSMLALVEVCTLDQTLGLT